LLKVLKGKVVSGLGEGAKYVSMPIYNILLTELLDEPPFPGTLNLKTGLSYKHLIDECPPSHIRNILIDGIERGGFYYWFGDIMRGGDKLTVLVLRPFLSKHGEDVLEVVSGVNLRKALDVRDGDDLEIRLICGVLPENG
jgi:riboflavin kinase